MKPVGFLPMQPICEVCDEPLDNEGVGRLFQNRFFHEACFIQHRAERRSLLNRREKAFIGAADAILPDGRRTLQRLRKHLIQRL